MTTTYDPIAITQSPKVGMFESVPSAEPGRVLVVDRPGRELRVLERPHERLTAGEARWGQIRTLFSVDVSEHHLDFVATVPCQDDAGGFRASVHLTCQVSDAAAVVRRGVHDVAQVLLPLLTETLRTSCRDFPAERSDAAEVFALVSLRERERDGGHDPAFRVSRIHLQLQLDDAAARYVRERKEADRDVIRQQDAARLEREKLRLEAEVAGLRASNEEERLIRERTPHLLEARLEDQRQQLELERAAARARDEQRYGQEREVGGMEFELKRRQIQADLDRQRLELDRERAELEAAYGMTVLKAQLDQQELKVQRLAAMLATGDFARLGLQLAQDPEAIHTINQYLARERHVDIERQLQALRFLVESDTLEADQITDQARLVLQRLTDTWSRLSTLPPGGSGPMDILDPAPDDDVVLDVRDTVVDVSDARAGSPADPEEFPGDREPPVASSAGT